MHILYALAVDLYTHRFLDVVVRHRTPFGLVFRQGASGLYTQVGLIRPYPPVGFLLNVIDNLLNVIVTPREAKRALIGGFVYIISPPCPFDVLTRLLRDTRGAYPNMTLVFDRVRRAQAIT